MCCDEEQLFFDGKDMRCECCGTYVSEDRPPDNAERHYNEPQPDPIPNDLPAVWDLVIKDMRSRDLSGLEKYGTRLQPHNGRNALQDAFEEALDLCVYLRQAIYERDHE